MAKNKNSTELFIYFFDLMWQDLVYMAKESKQHGHNIPSSINVTFISLIPKKAYQSNFANTALCTR